MSLFVFTSKEMFFVSPPYEYCPVIRNESLVILSTLPVIVVTGEDRKRISGEYLAWLPCREIEGRDIKERGLILNSESRKTARAVMATTDKAMMISIKSSFFIWRKFCPYSLDR